ncbi:hypothetical protein [Streptomyces sp. NPDC017941]|uniref:hypothetical protein n=1 Tax=Streptomyces sp. NPDC017941 TaxID=3365018 RepID=UPI0037897A92
MRLRSVAAAAALVLCATLAAAACSSSSDAADTTRRPGPAAPTKPAAVEVKGHSGTVKRQSTAPRTNEQDPVGSAKCATSAADIPAECALDLSFGESSDGEPGPGAPAAH